MAENPATENPTTENVAARDAVLLTADLIEGLG